jgi:glycosyltransferase involved in cell wall biosynthesis
MIKMDVLVMPHLDHIHSTNFSSPLKMFEYITLKKPIVATDLLSTKEILRDGENAILVKPNDPEALASGIKLVLENKELAKRIAENAYKDVCENYTWEKRADKILSIL